MTSSPGRLRVNAFGLSLDGYGAGPNQDLQNPLGVGGTRLHGWFYPTRTFRKMVLGEEGGATCTEHVPTAAATHVVLTRGG